jgi:putative Mg2+ transporter-C (MgtC) family protein
MFAEALFLSLTAIFRIVFVFFGSIMFGLERQQSHKPVGLPTFSFVSLGAAALGVIASTSHIMNASSLLAGIVTGIGFLGAGALVRGSDRVYGFTTASAIWLFAIFGLTIGIGEYLIGVVIYSLIWVVIFVDRHLEQGGIGTYQRRLSLTTNKIVHERELNKLLVLHTKRHKLLCAEIDKEHNEVHLTYLVDGPREHLNKMIHDLYEEQWFKTAKID